MLNSLRLRNFRCFESLSCALPAGTSVLVGENAQGKTSILEAVCVLLRLQSPRTSRAAELIRFSQQEFGLAGTWQARELKHTFTNGERQLFLDGNEGVKSSEYLQASGLVVWMGNGDLELVAGSSEPRRRYMDFVGSQIFPEYRDALKRFEKALKSRNALLKRDATPPWREIDAYTQILAANAVVLTQLRTSLTEYLLPHAATAQHQISGAREQLHLQYLQSGGPDLAETLAQNRELELARRVTAAGPHRDDLILTIDGKPAGQFGSEGQQRTMALALKLAQATLLQEKRATPPLLLLDDIFGELDPLRRNALLASLPRDSQKLVTTTHLNWLQNSFAPDALFQVHQGTVSTH